MCRLEPSFFQQAFIEYLLCAWHHGVDWQQSIPEPTGIQNSIADGKRNANSSVKVLAVGQLRKTFVGLMKNSGVMLGGQ